MRFFNWVCLLAASAAGGLAFATAVSAAVPNCFDDKTISVCVKSALVIEVGDVNTRFFRAKVSLNLEIVNKSEYPVDMILLAQTEKIALAPEHADALLNSSNGGYMQISGIKFCVRERDCAKPREGMTTFAPKTPVRVQIGYEAQMLDNALPQLQLATKATLSATLFVSERGAPVRSVPIPTGEFAFSNGYAR